MGRRPHVEIEANDTEWAYLAGIIDGEGCIHNHRQPNGRPRPMLTIAQKYPIFLEEILAVFGGYLYQREDRSLWRITGGRFETVMYGVMPYLILKKPQAKIALKMLDADFETGERLYKKLSQLKKERRTSGRRRSRRK